MDEIVLPDEYRPLVSDDRRYTREDIDQAPAGVFVQSRETLWLATEDDDGFGKGLEVGTVVINESKTDDAAVTVYIAHFILNDANRSRMTVHGVVPMQGGRWVGEERGGVSGRTGWFSKWPEEIPVVGKNPKRWGT
jgi:hypothetical protein